jgi:hypothetical protein
MKRGKKIHCALALLFALCVSAQTKPLPNVKDYFLALPQKYFENQEQPNHEWMLAAKRGSIVDLKNGYLFAQGDGAQVSIWVCLFKKKDGNHLIAVQTTVGDTDEITYLYFYLYERGKWKDVTKQTLPVKHHNQYRYNLPRDGQTIKVTMPSGKKLYDWEWNKEKFILKK